MLSKSPKSQRGFGLAFIIVSIVLIAALVYFLAVSSQSDPDTISAENARTAAQNIIQQSLDIERELIRYAGLYGPLDTLPQPRLLYETLRPGTAVPQPGVPGMDELGWQTEELPFPIAKYTPFTYAMLVLYDLPERVCTQVNLNLLGSRGMLTLTEAGEQGIAAPAPPDAVQRLNSHGAGCFNYNPRRGVYRERVFVRFIPVL